MGTIPASQVSSELRAVTEIVQALDLTMRDTENPRARTSIVHGLEFLEDHLQRLYGIEEHGGLLDILIILHPELQAEVHRLESEHHTICAEAHRLVAALCDSQAPSDECLQDIVRKLRHLVAGILRHEHHERLVLLDSINVVDGGEG